MSQKNYNLLLIRLFDNGHDTEGLLYYPNPGEGLRYVFTLEDEYRKNKVAGETRIPAGKYEIRLRREGLHFQKYCNHKNLAIKKLTEKYGILELMDVPNFKYILIHIGNDEGDTAGCILIGDKTRNNSDHKGFIEESTNAYIKFVSAVFAAFEREQRVFITIVDKDRDVQEQFKGAV